jgi:D-threo-aldose 1-dehydrogenase
MERTTFITPAGQDVALTHMGFGGVPIGNMGSVMSDAEAVATVRAALDLGIGYVDVAPLYGHGLSERRVGMALARRSDVTLSSKVGRLLVPCAPGEQDSGIYRDVPQVKVRFDYSHDGVMRSHAESVERLGREIDILYVHDVDSPTHGSESASDARIAELIDSGGWRALQELRDAGRVKAIGAGVNEVRACLKLLDVADPDMFLLAGRYTLLEQQALDALLPRCVERGVGVVVGGPYNSGILATGAVPGAWYNYAPANDAIMAQVSHLEQICTERGVPLAAAALQFPLLHPAVVSVIPGGRSPDEVARNAALLDVPIPDALWSDLKMQGLLRKDAPC